MLIRHQYCLIHCQYLVGSSRASFDQLLLLVPCGSFIDHTITKLIKIDIKMSVFVENESPVQLWFIFYWRVMQIQWNSWAQHTKFDSNNEMPIKIGVFWWSMIRKVPTMISDQTMWMIQQGINNDDQSNSINDGLTLTKQNKNNGMTNYLQSIKCI